MRIPNHIRMTQQIDQANAVTHGGLFHADDVMAAAILARLGDLTIYRCSPKDDISSGAIIFDVGSGAYDHHQKGGNGVRGNGVPYASCGLIWRDFGRDVVHAYDADLDRDAQSRVWAQIDHKLMEEIDAADNGFLCSEDALGTRTSITNLISSLNPTWEETREADGAFLCAVHLAGAVLERALASAVSQERASVQVTAALASAEGHILVLPRFVPWKKALLDLDTKKSREIWYVVFPSIRGGYCCQCVPGEQGRFSQRMPLPAEWHGSSAADLRNMTGIETILFCHPNGFLCGAETLEDALHLARLAVNTHLEREDPPHGSQL